jgi:hypothetical protein
MQVCAFWLIDGNMHALPGLQNRSALSDKIKHKSDEIAKQITDFSRSRYGPTIVILSIDYSGLIVQITEVVSPCICFLIWQQLQHTPSAGIYGKLHVGLFSPPRAPAGG